MCSVVSSLSVSGDADAVVSLNDDGVEVFTQSQGIYEDRKQIARILGISEKSVKVNLVGLFSNRSFLIRC